MEEIESLFYDLENGFMNLNSFSKKLQEYGINIPNKQLKQWYNNQFVNQIYTKPKQQHKKIVCSNNNIGCVQIDLMDLGKLKGFTKFNFLLTGIDIYSRYGWAFTLNDKKPSSVLPYIKQIVEDIQNIDKYTNIIISSDSGSEFKNVVSKYINTVGKHIIIEPTVVSKHSLGLIERFNRTIWTLLRKILAYNSDFTITTDIIEKIVSNYNNRYHRSIKTTPLNVFTQKQFPADLIYDTQHAPKYKVGDTVRFLLKKQKFDKGTLLPNFSSKIYTIQSINGNNYVLSNKKTKKENELLLVEKPDYNSNINIRKVLNNDEVKENIQDKKDKDFEIELDEEVPISPKKYNTRKKMISYKKFF